MNAGIGSYVKPGELFGCSYTDFAPALRPRVPVSDSGINLDETELLPFAIYPNPAQDYLNISSEQNGQLQVYNQQGALIVSQSFYGQAQLDLSDWTAGLYFVQLNGKSQRLIIH